MAEYLASIFGTEKDKVNCSFYFKIGACRHGDRCSRLHNKPTFSQTIALLNIYRNPQNSAQSADGLTCAISDMEMQEHYDEFFEEVFTEMEEKYGEVEEMNVCDNLGDHLVGNVYVKFRCEEDAEKAVIDLNNRWFNGQPIHAELSPVTDFREACCRQYEMGECTRGGFCNFMHLKPISRELRRELYGRRRKGGVAVTGPGHAPETGDPAQGTGTEEAEGADATTIDAAPGIESVRDVSEPQARTTCFLVPFSPIVVFASLSLFFFLLLFLNFLKVCTLPLIL
ncbi:splicing factor U2AF 35 kDa subunit isoform X1 [Hippocampus comes]|uniref:splicing factor U2AF 35 kDa subunit isoform X1 n=1 Tax=Hippocampus comes TaxID=109280 RepID=UPI00094E2F80|nr:PREDICTED: splicing factor U2AF 35 kDa subunit isoform X1 [Hippocampus comes]